METTKKPRSMAESISSIVVLKKSEVTKEDLEQVGCTLTPQFMICASFAAIAFIGIYIGLLASSILQSQSAAVAPISLVNGGPNGNDNGWTVYTAMQASPPKGYATHNVSKTKSGNNRTLQHQYGVFPVGWWDPVLQSDGKPRYNNGPGRFTSLRIEVSIKSLSPAPTGATSVILFRVILPNHWFDQSSQTLKPLYMTSCNIGSYFINTTEKMTVPYLDLKVDPFQLPYGTVQLYPLDKFSVDTDIQCQFQQVGNPDNSGYLNHYLAIDSSDVGVFSMTNKFHDPGYSYFNQCLNETIDRIATDDVVNSFYFNSTYPNDDNVFHSRGSHEFKSCSKYIQLVPASFGITLRRSPVNIVFPIYAAFAMWIMVIAQTLAFLPYYFGVKIVDNYAIPLAVFTILFALPNVRNTMPGVPPIGVVIDFASYFWCILVAVTHVFLLSTSWYFYGGFLDARVKAKKAALEEVAKKLNKGIKKLTVADVISLFHNTGRDDFNPAVIQHDIDGKILAMIKNRDDILKLELTTITVKQMKLLISLEEWNAKGVALDLLKDPILEGAFPSKDSATKENAVSRESTV